VLFRNGLCYLASRRPASDSATPARLLLYVLSRLAKANRHRKDLTKGYEVGVIEGHSRRFVLPDVMSSSSSSNPRRCALSTYIISERLGGLTFFW
jgi:hypothetical protein